MLMKGCEQLTMIIICMFHVNMAKYKRANTERNVYYYFVLSNNHMYNCAEIKELDTCVLR